MRFGLKRGKLLYVFKYPAHDVERDKHRNVITRARFIKESLEQAGYSLVPWDFKKGKPPKFWERGTMDEEDDDLYGPSETTAPAEQKKEEPKKESDDEGGDEPMDEGLESGEEEDEESSDSVGFAPAVNTQSRLTRLRTSKSSSTSRKPHQSQSSGYSMTMQTSPPAR